MTWARTVGLPWESAVTSAVSSSLAHDSGPWPRGVSF